MPPPAPPRRSTRLKKRAAAAAVAAAATTAEPTTEPTPPPPKKRTLTRSAPDHRGKPLSAPSPYTRNDQTLFLGDDLNTVHWTPPQTRFKRSADIKAVLDKHDNDVHDYFISKRAAQLAALDCSPVNIYRHIGTVLLEGLRVDAISRDFAQKSTENHVNLARAIRFCDGKNRSLIDALYSLTESGQRPYVAPYIVLLVDRDQFLAVDPQQGSDLIAQVYVGRLLFELIALDDAKIVFEALQPSVPYEPMPKMREYPPTLGKSPSPGSEDAHTLSGLLRRAESVGYASLTDEQRKSVNDHLTVDLYPFQEQTVRWMIDKEDDKYFINDYFWEERSFTGSSTKGHGGHFYYFPKAGELRLSKPPQMRGGMVTEEMGLGKTVEALALIAAQKKPHAVREFKLYFEIRPTGATIKNGKVSVPKLRQQNQDSSTQTVCPLQYGDIVKDSPNRPFPKRLTVRRWPAKTTLVLCPKSLLAQWKHEAELRAPSLSVVEWEVPHRGNAGTDCNVAVGEHAKDIVLATYETLQKDPRLSRITWKRLILDEAQVTRRSSTQVARDTFNLRSEARFLMTGTPIVHNIDDLRGELAFLRIWPFTLFEDGFWESQIYCPFRYEGNTTLVDHLLSVTMMRHTKAQQLSLSLPPRSYETIEVELSSSHRAVYCFILACCLEELDTWTPRRYYPRQLRALLRLLLSSCVSPALLSLTALDLARRSIWGRRGVFNESFAGGCRKPVLEKLSATDAIRFLAETGTYIVRDSNRTHSTLHASILNPLDLYMRMDIEDLRKVVASKGLLPQTRGTVRRERLAQLAAGGVHRLVGDTAQELRETIVELGLRTPLFAATLSRNSAMGVLLRHYAGAGDSGASSSIHEAGFAALTKLIERNESPGCPVCLTTSMERVSLTKCGHFYCVDCLILMFETSNWQTVRCAICRREIRAGGAVEVLKPHVHQEGAGGTAGASVESTAEKERKSELTKQSMTFIARTDASRYCNAPRPTANEVLAEYEGIAQAPARFGHIGLNPDAPSLDADFLRHLAAATSRNAVAPKLYALRSLIRSCSPETKFCVVAETSDSLKGICDWLTEQGISCVGVGAPGWSGNSRSIGQSAQQFSADPSVRVFLLNTANTTGLTLTTAQYVVFMEPMLRVTDEMQAAARVHRIGQTRPVKIVRIVAKNTVEEQIMFRRGEIQNPGQETDALLAADGREAPTKDLVRLFRDLRDWEQFV